MNRDLFVEVQVAREAFVAAYSDWVVTKYSRRELNNVLLVKRCADDLSMLLSKVRSEEVSE